LCIGTAALIASSGTSASGLAALLFKRRARKHEPITPRADDRDRDDEAQEEAEHAQLVNDLARVTLRL
jgi:hypothetical protein